jgi:hypothetical protein
MAKNEIKKIEPDMQLPAFMQNVEAEGVEELKGFVIPPSIKIVQKQSSDDLLNLFSPGDAIITPHNKVIAKIPLGENGKPTGEPGHFKIVPILFFPEWIVWNPLESRGSEPAIHDRTFDMNSPIVAKAKNPQLRKEKHPTLEGKFRQYTEHLNFLCMVMSAEGDLEEPALLSFARTNHAAGSKLASLIKLRKAPIYGCIFDVFIVPQKNEKGSWYGFEVANPSNGPAFVSDEALFNRYQEIHREMKELQAEQRISLQYEDGETQPTPEASNDF